MGHRWINFIIKIPTPACKHALVVGYVRTHMCWFVFEPITARYLLLPDTSAYGWSGWSGCAEASFVCTACMGQWHIQMFLHRDQCLDGTILNLGHFLWMATRVINACSASTTLWTSHWSKSYIHRVNLNICYTVTVLAKDVVKQHQFPLTSNLKWGWTHALYPNHRKCPEVKTVPAKIVSSNWVLLSVNATIILSCKAVL